MLKYDKGMVRILAIYGIRDDMYVRVAKNTPQGMVLEFEACVDFLSILPNNGELRITKLFLPFIVMSKEEGIGVRINPGSVDLIFNAICEPGRCKHAMEAFLSLLKEAPGVPVINHPELLDRTYRDTAYQLLTGIDGLYVPKTIRIKPKNTKQIIVKALEENIFPFIFRQAHQQTNVDAELILSKDDIYKLEKYSFIEQEYYLTEFVDYRSEDGLYRKYRVIVIDGRMYPRHMIVSDTWNIHAKDRNRLMNAQTIYRDEEKTWLKTFSEDKYPQIREIINRLGLDYFAIDFGHLKDGRIVLFEASPCFKYRTTDIDKIEPIYSYHKDYILAIERAILEMIRKRAKRLS